MSTETVRNEAAERLTACGECGMHVAPGDFHPYTYCVLYKAGQDPRKAFAAERRATVERIRERLLRHDSRLITNRADVAMILDEEAAR